MSLLLAVQTVLTGALTVYVRWSGDHAGYFWGGVAGTALYGGLWWAYQRGIEQARHATVLLISLLVIVTLREPYLTEHASIAVLVPPAMALILVSPAWVIGSIVFQFVGLSLRAGMDSIWFRPVELALAAMVVSGLVVSRKVLEGALLEAGRAREDAERRARELLEQRERADRLESELLHAQRLESLGRLAGGVAHDFNNLLTVISGSATLAARSLSLEHRAGADILEIQNATKRAAELTGQLLAFARRQVLVKRVLDVRDLLRSIERMLGRLLGERIELETKLSAEPMLVNADAGQLEQVLLNLVLNARDAMPAGGCVTISVEHSAPPGARSSVRGNGYVRIDVTDTGAGMSEQVSSRVFEPFFTTKELGRGTGLGLATSLGVVEQHDGQLELRSEPGHGSTFSVYLPSARQRPNPENPSVVRALPRGNERVLLVEDDPHVRTISARVLEEAGYAVCTARDADEALVVLDRESCDVLVSDVVMPGRSGVELAREAGSARPELGIVLMSGYNEAQVVRSSRPASEQYLQKPFSPRALIEAVQRALEHTSAARVARK